MKIVLEDFHREGVNPREMQAVKRVFSREMMEGGRFCRRMGLKSSGPAALSCLKECIAWKMSLSLIQGKSRMGLKGAERVGGGGPMMEFSGKCSSTRAARDASIEVVVEPSESVRWPMELELILC